MSQLSIDDVERCGSCGGSGVFFVWLAGARQPKGPCFRCRGKGFQTPADMIRNERFDEWSAARAITSDIAEANATQQTTLGL